LMRDCRAGRAHARIPKMPHFGGSSAPAK
jgi:hypothetical protein